MVVPFFLSHRSLLQIMTHSFPHSYLQWLRSPGSSGILSSSWWQKRAQLRGLLPFLLAELQQLHSILCCQRAESDQKWWNGLSLRVNVIALYRPPPPQITLQWKETDNEALIHIRDKSPCPPQSHPWKLCPLGYYRCKPVLKYQKLTVSKEQSHTRVQTLQGWAFEVAVIFLSLTLIWVLNQWQV